MINGNRKTILVQMRRQRRYGNGNGKLLSLVLKVVSLVVVATISGTLLTTGIGVGTAVAAYVSLTKTCPTQRRLRRAFSRRTRNFSRRRKSMTARARRCCMK